MTARRTRRNALLAVIAMSAVSGWSEDSQDPLPRGWTRGVAVSPEVQALYEERDRDLAAGIIAMQDMEENPHRGIDAAILFGKVLSEEDAGELLPTGTVDDKTNRYIYFCSKSMEAADAKAYLLAKSTRDRAAFLVAKKALDREKGQGADYATSLADTARWDDRNKTGFDAMVVDFEILDLFPGMTFADDITQDLSRAQDRYADQLAQEQDSRYAAAEARLEQHSTRFSAGALQPTSDLVPIPSASEQALALHAITAQYGMSDGMSVARQRTIARQLATDADVPHVSAARVFAMFALSERLAQASEEYETLLSDFDTEGVMFAGFNAIKQERRSLLAMDMPAAKAALKLIEDPASDNANSTLGLFYVGQLHRWKLGMQMLACGSDRHLKAAVEQDWQDPTTIAEQIAMGDTWYALGQKVSAAERDGLWTRAEFWYQKAEIRVAGKALQHVTANLQAIDSAYPEAIEDWSAITAAEFSRLRGRSLLLDAHVGQLDTGLALKAGQSVRVVVAPLDCWQWTNPVGQPTTAEACCGYEVKVMQPAHGQGDLERQGVLTMGLDDGAHVTYGLVTGPGELWLYAENPEKLLGSGTARIMILPDPDG